MNFVVNCGNVFSFKRRSKFNCCKSKLNSSLRIKYSRKKDEEKDEDEDE
jgi:hypothetical protein